MDNNKKLSEGLLKADGIDPANITESERMVFRQMLDREEKHMKHLSWITLGPVLIFTLAMVGLFVSENILDALRIPFVVGFLVIMAAMLIIMIRYTPSHNRRLRESGRKISKLYYLVHGKYRGIILVGKKDGKHFIYWLRIIIIAAGLWLIISLVGAGVWYLFSQSWIISSSPLLHIFYSTVISLSLVIFVLRDGLKTPLEELVEVKAKSKQSNLSIARPDIWRVVMRHKLTKLVAAALIPIAIILGLNIISGSGIASVALADVAREIEQVKNCVFQKTTILSSEDNGANSFDSVVYYTEAAVREDIFDNQKITYQVYVKFSEGILVGVDHKTKVFTKMDLADEDLEKMSPVSPRNIVNLILGKGKYKELGRKTVDGVLSEGFEFSDKRAIISMDKDKIENIVTRLWVDVNTNLPARVEVDCVLINDSKANLIMCDPEWDVELEPDFFEPKIPVGYMRPEQRGLIGINLEDWPTANVVKDMPAEKAGVKSGDVVIKVGDNIIPHDMSSGDALTLLSGKAGEKVVLTVKRGEQVLTFEIERAPMPE